MTIVDLRRLRILRFCFLVCVFTSGFIAIIGSASRPPQPPRPTTDVDETKPHSVVQLIAVTPSMALPDQRTVTIDRRYQVKSEWLVSSWYTTRVSQYIPKGTILLVDRDLQFGFGFSSLDLASHEGSVSSAPLGLSLVVRNGSARGVTIDWNAVTIIDHMGRARGVIHRGVKMADRSGILAPSTIPPGAILEDFVYPKELLSFSGGRYGSGWTAVNFFEAMKPGQQFKLYLPVKHGTETVEYQFVFEANAPTE
jgi:hypothetical protein